MPSGVLDDQQQQILRVHEGHRRLRPAFICVGEPSGRLSAARCEIRPRGAGVSETIGKMESVGNVARSGAVTTVAQLLEAAREGLPRLSPEQAHVAVRAGAALVDIRSDEQRRQDGEIACATCIARNVLEWRLDPACPHRDRELARRDRVVIVVCDEGYQSSLAAATLRRFGLDAADVIGGFQAWRAAGLPVER
jgi:rhodanese-related sulfurtransferase